MPSNKNTTKKTSPEKSLMLTAGMAVVAATGYFLFGPKGKQNRKKVKAWTIKAKAEVLEKIEGLEMLAEDKYYDIVDKVSAKYEKNKAIANEEVQALSTELKKYWKNIQKDLAPKKKPAPKPKTKK